MKIYRLEPAASTGDSNWDRANDFGCVIVRAESPADARVAASHAEAALIDAGGGVKRGSWSPFSSAFCDEKLYHAVEDQSGIYAGDGRRGVLAGLGAH